MHIMCCNPRGFRYIHTHLLGTVVIHFDYSEWKTFFCFSAMCIIHLHAMFFHFLTNCNVLYRNNTVSNKLPPHLTYPIGVQMDPLTFLKIPQKSCMLSPEK